MSRVKKRREIERPSALKLLLRRQRRNLRLLALFAVGSAAVYAAMAATHSARTGGTVAHMAASFGRATDLHVERIVFSATNNPKIAADDPANANKCIKFDTRTNTPTDRLIGALGVQCGDAILGFSVSNAQARLETLPWIAHVSVQRRLPGEIHVALTESRPFAIWQNNNDFVLVDHDGAPVAGEDVTRFGELPLIVGQGAPQTAAGIIELLRAYPALQNRIDAYVRVGDRRWNIHLRNKTLVMLPEGHEAEAIKRLTEIDATQQILTRPLAVIDMRLADKMYIRPQASETASADPAADTAAAAGAAAATPAATTAAKPAAAKPAAQAAKKPAGTGKPAATKPDPAKAAANARIAAHAQPHPAGAKIAPAHSVQPHSADSIPRDIMAERRAT